MEGWKFRLPVQLKPEEVEGHLRDRRCLVVAFFWKSPYGHRWGSSYDLEHTVFRAGKSAVLDEVLGRPVFYPGGEEGEAIIEGYFDPNTVTVYLHMKLVTININSAVTTITIIYFTNSTTTTTYFTSSTTTTTHFNKSTTPPPTSPAPPPPPPPTSPAPPPPPPTSKQKHHNVHQLVLADSICFASSYFGGNPGGGLHITPLPTLKVHP